MNQSDYDDIFQEYRTSEKQQKDVDDFIKKMKEYARLYPMGALPRQSVRPRFSFSDFDKVFLFKIGISGE